MKLHLFSKLIVLYCLALSTLASLWALWIAHRSGLQITGLLSVILGLFGGELLLLCLKRLLEEPKRRNRGEGRSLDAE